MANSITTRATTPALTDSVPSMPMSTALYRAYENTARPHPDIGPPRNYADDVKAEAVRVLATLQPYVAPPAESMVAMWIGPVLYAVRNSRSEDAVAGWLQALYLAAASLPVGAFTAETQRAALHGLKFFPSVADVMELLSVPAREIRTKVSTLRRIAEA